MEKISGRKDQKGGKIEKRGILKKKGKREKIGLGGGGGLKHRITWDKLNP